MKSATRSIAILMLSGIMAGPALAQTNTCGVQRNVKAGLLDEATYKQLNRAYEEVGAENYDGAYDFLIKIRARARDDYLKAVVAQGLAQVEWARGNYDPALQYFEEAVALDALPDQPHFALMYQIAQLYYMKERYDESLERLDLWFCTVPPEKVTPAAYVLKASINAQKEDWPEVVKAISQAIDMEPDPKESWYQLKLAAHFELEQFPEAADTLEVMITKWPNKKDYWTQLSNVRLRLKQDDRALSVMALAYRNGLLDKQADIIYLSNLYSFLDVPYKAAKVLQKGIEDGMVEANEKHWTVVADMWYAAEEMDRALQGYEQAGKVAEDGKIDLRRAYILIDQENWPEAIGALSDALKKGGITERQTGEAYLMRGMAEFNLGNYDQASTNWGRASRYPKSKDSAEQWMNHMREERARRSS